ncbi:MAG: type I glutamate--ammonia ligase [Erysipelotrichales bacterium]|nr:type I glutamate--ammonia ligase [Erysipelotrichales bacterium]
MEKYTKKDILEIVNKEDIRYICLQFSDMLGMVKSVEIPSSQLEKALDNKIMFDGSSIEGFIRINEADMYLHPDFSTFLILDWENKSGPKVARLICDVYKPNGMPFEGDPRFILKRNLQKMEKFGFLNFNVGFEAEFYLLKTKEDGSAKLEFSDHGGYFDMAPIDKAEECRRDIVISLENMGFKMEVSHHEVGPGQNEINFTYADALSACDNIQTFKIVVKNIARKYGLYATFMPKPVEGFAGNGMHTNCSLQDKDGNNAFDDPNANHGLSQICRKWISGILKHSQGLCAITNPTVNSYKRLVSGYEAPCYVAWADSNRSTMIRIPSVRGLSTRTEIRSVDSSTNPYLATSAILCAGLDGIENCDKPIENISRNRFKATQEELDNLKITSLPENLKEAIEFLKKDSLLIECLGNHTYSKFIEAKMCEWEKYRTQVTKWEIDYYLNKL